MPLHEISSTPLSRLELRDPVRVSPTAPLHEVVSEMTASARGAAVVQDSAGRLLGIFTERDLLRAVDVSNDQWRARPVGEVMVSELRTIQATGSLHDAITAMAEISVRHLPIVRDDGYAVGLLSVRDIVAYVASYFPAEFLNLPPDPDLEARSPWGA